MKKLFNFSQKVILIIAVILAQSVKTLAICPVCTIAVGAGIELSHWLKVDDSITGLWIGAFAVSISWWTVSWLKKKKFKTFGKIIWVPAIYFITIYYTLITQNFLFIPGNTLWGVDKLIFSGAIGALAFFWTAVLYLNLKKKNHNKPHFPYEKIAISVGALLFLSIVFYFITN